MKNPLSPRWQSDDPAVRLEAVQNGNLSPQVLQQIATEDTRLDIKDAALARIEDQDFLLQLANTEPSAGKRWAELVGADLAHLDIINGQPENLLLSVAMHAPKEEFRLKSVEALSEAARCEVMRHENLSKVHQHCASAIDNEDNLTMLQKLFIGKDKNVSRILKSKLQALKHAREVAAAEALELETLLERTEQLRQAEPGPDYGRRIDVLRQAFSNLPHPELDAAQQIKALLAECDEVFATLPDPAEILKAQLETIAAQCATLHEACVADPGLADLKEQLTAIQATWPDEADDSEKPEHLTNLEALAHAQSAWGKLIAEGDHLSLEHFEQNLSDLDWPEQYSKPETYSSAIDEIRQKLTIDAEKQAEIDAAQAELDQQIERFEQQISEGHIKAANKANTRVTRSLANAHPRQAQISKVQQLQSKLQELKDWQGFATQPKRDELCAKMKLLVDDTAISMPEKAKAIKELQEQWRQLGSSDSRPARRSWAKFKNLGDQAYAPVAEHFAAQQTVREEHLQARAEICTALEQLESTTDWDNFDQWRQLSSDIFNYGNKWRQHGNVPRRDKKAIEKRYDDALAPLKQRLNKIQKRHIEQKEALINELKTKLEDEQTDINGLINRAKAAQQEWQKIGFIDRRKDQKLWKAFRQQCDAVFNKRDAEKQSERDAAKQVAADFRDICKQFEASLEGAFSRKEISAFRKQIAAVQLPKNQRGLEREAKNLIKQAESELKARARQGEELMFREFQKRCEQLDQGLAPEIDPDITLSKELQSALDGRSDKAPDAQDQILIRLEILADLESPETSQAARMQYQVERLNRELSLGQKETRSEREQVQDLLTQWYSTSNKQPEWQPRFQNIATKLGLPR